MIKQFYPFLLGIALAGGTIPVAAQVLEGSNGSRSELAPLTLNKQTARQLSTRHARLRADFVQSNRHYFVVGFQTMLSPQATAVVERHAQILAYLPNHLYLLAATESADRTLAALKRELQPQLAVITTQGTLPAHYKLETQLYSFVKSGEALTDEVRNKGILVSTFDETDRTALEKTLKKWKAPYQITLQGKVLLTDAHVELVAQVAALPYVNFVSLRHEENHDAFDTQYIMQTNRIFSLNYDLKGPTGKGVTFANWETHGAEPDYKINTAGRNIARPPKGGGRLNDNSFNAHGTACGLIATGTDNIDENKNRGMAPGMDIIAMNDNIHPWGMHQAGVKRALDLGFSPLVSNHSVGWFIWAPTQYDADAATVDKLTYDSNAYICCYPTGNVAYGKNRYGKYKDYDYGYITGHIKNNKNGFTVHSVVFPGVDASWACFGPTFDGRMKPEVCTQGLGGTSYASPGVAGLTGTLLEQCKTTFGVARADVVKAVIINTALDVRTYADNGKEEGYGIDYRTGYGEVHPAAAARSIAERRVDYSLKVGDKEQQERKITLPAGQSELNVTLYWNDPAASAGTAKALINDLDLEVVDPTGKVILPWTLDPSPENVTKEATRAVNTRDNHERVRITVARAGEVLTPGEYTIRVRGTKVPKGPQEFALTWQWKPRGIEWTAFPEGYRVEPGESLLLTWDMTISEQEDRKAPNFKEDGIMTPRVYYRTKPIDPDATDDPTQPSSGWKPCSVDEDTQYWENDMKGNQRPVYGMAFGKNFLKWHVPAYLKNTAHLQFLVVAGMSQEHPIRFVSPKAQVCERPEKRPEVLALSETKATIGWELPKTIKKGKCLVYALYDKYMTKMGEFPIEQQKGEITSPEGVKWNQNQFFAISYYDEDTGAYGKRSLPIGLDPYNEEATDADKIWVKERKLCPGDVLHFNTNKMEGDVQWFKNNRPLPADQNGNARVLPITMTEAGTYYYTITVDGKRMYKSPNFSITSGKIQREETADWGDHSWKCFVYGKQKNEELPTLTETTPYRGRFSLNKFSFDSNEDFIEDGKGNLSDAPGYVGCPSGNATEAFVVMKRKGFSAGEYHFSFKHLTGLVRVIITDADGKQVVKTSSPGSETFAWDKVKLNEKSTVELHWSGERCALQVTYAATPETLSLRPGRADGITPSFWLDPNGLQGEDNSEVVRLNDSYPQAEDYTLITKTAARLDKAGSNYNAALVFDGKSCYTGGMRSPNKGLDATDFLVVATQPSGNDNRIVSFGNGDQDHTFATCYTIVSNNANQLATIRNHNKVNDNNKLTHMSLITVQRNQHAVTINHNGKTTRNEKGSLDLLNLQKISIGGSFNSAQPNYLKGSLAEVLHYDSFVSEKDAQLIRTYLAIKHGITLSHDYVGAGGTLYRMAEDQKYRYQVTALGREDRSRLHQKQSRGQFANGMPAHLTLTLGELATDNAGNKATFAADGSYYFVAADSNESPLKTEGDVSGVHFVIRTVLPPQAKADSLSFLLPSDYVKEKKKAFLEISDKEFTSNEIDTKNTLLPLDDYVVTQGKFLRAKHLPALGATYFRIVWKDDPTSIHSLSSHTDLVHYDASTNVVTVGITEAQSVDVYDVSGKQLSAGLPLRHGKALLPVLPAGTYVLSVRGATGTLTTEKINVLP